MTDGPKQKAVRALVRGAVQGVGYRDATLRRARELGAMGWVRNEADGSVAVHAEGRESAVDALVSFLGDGPRGADVVEVRLELGKVEGQLRDRARQLTATC